MLAERRAESACRCDEDRCDRSLSARVSPHRASDQFDRVLSTRTIQLRCGCFRFYATTNEEDGARLGLIVGKRQLKRAVDRNRVKRVLRETFRVNRVDAARVSTSSCSWRIGPWLMSVSGASRCRCGRVSSQQLEQRMTNDLPKRAAISLISGYRYFLSPFFGQHCRFHPTCSAYAIEAIERHGAARGMLARAAHDWDGAIRFAKVDLDPVPSARRIADDHCGDAACAAAGCTRRDCLSARYSPGTTTTSKDVPPRVLRARRSSRQPRWPTIRTRAQTVLSRWRVMCRRTRLHQNITTQPSRAGRPRLMPTDRFVKVTTDTMEVWIDRLGGDIVRVQLPRYPVSIEKPNDPFLLLDRRPDHVYIAQSGLDRTRRP